jgi:hypothetical protein
MTRAERIELGLMAMTVAVVAWSTPDLRWTPAVGALIGYGAALLLAQGLVRDVAKLVQRRVASAQRQRIACLCAESSVGIGLLTIAIGLTLAGITEPVTISRGVLVAGVAVVLIFGFVAKDYVITIRREKDHARIIPW